LQREFVGRGKKEMIYTNQNKVRYVTQDAEPLSGRNLPGLANDQLELWGDETNVSYRNDIIGGLTVSVVISALRKH
jgi:hypothetical protein